MRHEFMALMNTSNDAIIVVALDRTILAWSRGAEIIFGFGADEMVGHSSDRLIPEPFMHHADEKMAGVAQGLAVDLYEAQRLTKEGTRVSVEISLTPIFDDNGNVSSALAIARDITARKRTEAALQARLRQQAMVAQLGLRALSDTNATTLVEEAVAEVAQVLDVELCKVLELLPDGRSLLLRAGVGWQEGLIGHATLSTEHGSQGAYALRSSAPVIAEDLALETRFQGAELLLHHGVVSGMTVIIPGLQRPFGVLGVHTTQKRLFTEDDIHFLQSIANILAEVIQHRQAQQEHEVRVNAEHVLADMQASVHQRALILETANRVALDILSNRSGVEALRHIAESARVLAGARYAALGVATPDGTELQEFIAVGMTPAQQAAIGPLPRGRGVLGHLLHCNQSLRIGKLSEHPFSSGFPANHPPMDTFLGVPIRRGDSVLGSLYLTNKQGGGPFTTADEDAVVALASHAAIAIHNLHMLARQQSLVRSLMTAQEEERRSIAHDLHDGLTQCVMASHAHLEAFQRARVQDKSEKAQRELQQGMAYLKEAVLESRRLVSGLRTLVLDDLGLGDALEQLLSEKKVQAGWTEATLECNLAGRRFDFTLETAVYRVTQEALNNIQKHASTSRVAVILSCEGNATLGEYLLLNVRDWGVGFDPADQLPQAGHFGLQGMSERVQLVGGTLQLQSQVGEGTMLEARFPILQTCFQ